MTTPDNHNEISAKIETLLDSLQKLFLSHCMLTLVVRDPESKEGDIVVTRDDNLVKVEHVIASWRWAEGEAKVANVQRDLVKEVLSRAQVIEAAGHTLRLASSPYIWSRAESLFWTNGEPAIEFGGEVDPKQGLSVDGTWTLRAPDGRVLGRGEASGEAIHDGDLDRDWFWVAARALRALKEAL